jgi:hypothetical protein
MKTTHTQSHRLVLLEAILLWEGRLNNARLRDIFDLKTVRASEWIKEFRDLHPDWIMWDRVTRSYHATDVAYAKGPSHGEGNFAVSASLTQYLALVGWPNLPRTSSEYRSAWAAYPDISAPSPKIFSAISEAIRLQRAMEVKYMSMRDPKPHKRIISPHSLVQAGRRWHVRAYSAEHGQFRDYALGRIVSARLLNISLEKIEADDLAWTTNVPVRLIAHPDLTAEQEAVIRYEYFNNTSARTDTCRGALVNYYIQDVRAATDPTKQKPPEFQLVVSNLEEVMPWLFPNS